MLAECQDRGLIQFETGLGVVGGGVTLTVRVLGQNGYELTDSSVSFEDTARLFWISPTGV